MKFTSIKQTLIGFTVFLIILFLGSCSVADDTAPPGAPPDYMNFTLTNASGTEIDPTTPLSRGSTYGLVITPGSGVMPAIADYTVTYPPTTAITINTTRTNSIDFTVNNTTDTTVTFTVTHRTASAISETITLTSTLQVVGVTFQQDIERATMPNLTLAHALTREVLEPLNVATGTPLVKRYVTQNGGATIQDGSSWANAWAATNLRNGINTISDATANKVYLIMVAGATYKPTYTTSRGDSFSMKNHVAIMGGFDPAGGWGRTGTTIFSGDIGTVGTTTDNSYHVFYHNNITLNNAHLYGVTITNGNANGVNPQNLGGGMYNNGASPVMTKVVFSGNTANNGGGMYNTTSSSPVMTEVVFSGNTANNGGGGMMNISSSPVLTEVVFSRNTATGFTGGGGMYNGASSSPVLTEVVFSGNTATGLLGGGGMYNRNSSPVLTRVVFSGNSANIGGGVYNTGSSPVLTEVVFSGNSATRDGGGMINANLSSPVMIGAVFSGNTATGTLGGGGMYNSASSPVMIGAVFTNNTAVNGGAMYNDNGGLAAGPLIVNTIFSGNTLSGAGSGTNIAMNRGGFSSGTETIRIAGSVLGMGLAQPTNAIVGYDGSDALNITYHSLANGVVNFGADANLTINGMNFPYPTITSGSAVNLGLFVRRSGTTYYFSEDESTWYTGFSATGAGGLVTVETPPANATDLTATDIAGNPRVGRPDAGVYEVQ